MQDYDTWKLENGYNDNESYDFEEIFKVSGESSRDFEDFEKELELLIEKYGYIKG